MSAARPPGTVRTPASCPNDRASTRAKSRYPRLRFPGGRDRSEIDARRPPTPDRPRLDEADGCLNIAFVNGGPARARRAIDVILGTEQASGEDLPPACRRDWTSIRRLRRRCSRSWRCSATRRPAAGRRAQRADRHHQGCGLRDPRAGPRARRTSDVRASTGRDAQARRAGSAAADRQVLKASGRARRLPI